MSKEDAKKFLEAAREYDFTEDELQEAAKEVDLGDKVEEVDGCQHYAWTAACTL